MEISKNIKGIGYKKLIEYAIKNCDVVSFVYRLDQHKDITNKFLEVLNNDNWSRKYIINNYSYKLIGKIFESYKDNNIIFDNISICYKQMLDKITDYNHFKDFLSDKKYQNYLINKYKKYGFKISFDNITHKEYKEFIKYDYRLDSIDEKINKIFYKNVVEKFIDKYKQYIIDEEKTTFSYDQEKEKITDIKYYIKITDELKDDILKRKSIFDWCFPFNIEDIEFYKDGYCWLFSVAHEKMFNIYCKNEKEYEFLKSIGVNFKNKKFEPISKEEIIYKNYKDCKNR